MHHTIPTPVAARLRESGYTVPETPYPFGYCAQWNGTVRHNCPKCGFIAVSRIGFGSYEWTCTNDECKAEWTIGLAVRPKAAFGIAGKPRTPRDTIFPTNDIIPMLWRAGDPVHVLYDDAGNVVTRPIRRVVDLRRTFARAVAARAGWVTRRAHNKDDDNKDTQQRDATPATPARRKPGSKRRKPAK